MVLIGIPGIKNEYTGRSEELLSDWLATNNKYACGDKQYFETIIKPYTCFVGIYVKVAWIRIPACYEYRIVEL